MKKKPKTHGLDQKLIVEIALRASKKQRDKFNEMINKIPSQYNNESKCQHLKQLLDIKNNYKEYCQKKNQLNKEVSRLVDFIVMN